MKFTKTLSVVVASTLIPTGTLADGYERVNLDTSFLYESGSHAEFGVGRVAPSVPAKTTAGVKFQDNIAPSFAVTTAAAKASIGDNLDLGFWYTSSGNGVLIDWGSNFPAAGLTIAADINFPSLVGIAKYRVSENLSLLGGIKRVSVDGGSSVTLPVSDANIARADYSLSTASATTGVFGIAYERPEIAFRVELISEGDTDLSVPTTFSQVKSSASGVDANNQTGTIEAGVGDAITLKFQTGIAANTLLFGNVRHSKWKNDQSFVPFLVPDGSGGTVETSGQVSDFGDSSSYTLGLGRRLNENISVSSSIYRSAGGNCDADSALAPTCGNTAISIGSKVNVSDNADLSLGFTWSQRGDATIVSGGNALAKTGSSTVTSLGAKLSFKF